MAETTQQADVVVVGAGIAGLTAALELLDNGRQVTLLDRCHPEEVGGLAREAFGGMFMVDSPQQRRSGIGDSYDLALDDWLRIAEFDDDDVWPRRWAEQYVARARDDVGKWLTEQGVWFFPVVNWAERGMYSDGNSVPRFHLTWGCGQGLIDAVWGKLQEHDNKEDLVVHFETNVTELIETGGAVQGVLLEDGTEIRADATVIAAGGIGGNLDLVKREWPKDMGDPPEQLLMGSHYYADGAMHDEVKRHGGNVTHIDRMWNYADAVRHPKPRRPLHGVKLIPPRSGLMLDPDGKRYGPVPVMPTFDARYALERMCEDPRKYSWLVCNRKIATRELDVSGSEHNPHIREKRLGRFMLSVLTGKPHLVDYFVNHCPDFATADTLPELAQKMNAIAGNDDLDADLMAKEIKRYDDMLARGKSLWNDDQIRRIAQYRNWRGDRLRTSKFQQIDDPKAGPLIAIRLQPMARKSLGGIQTDLESRVLTTDGDPISNLYACGEAAGFGGGGMHGRRSLEGTFLGGCVFSARIAAQSIAHGATVTHSTNGDVPAGAVEAE
ncbi:MAG: FAD-binding dehydrogenase [Thermoleophilaceae bacterium]